MSLLRNDFPYHGGVSLLFDQPVALLTEMREAIGLLTTIAADRLRRDRLLTRKVTVWLETEYRDGALPAVRSRTTDLPVPVNDPRLLTVFTCGAVDEVYRPSMRYRAAGVYCEDLTVDDTATAAQIDHTGQRTARPYGAVHRAMGRYPRRSVRPPRIGLRFREYGAAGIELP